MIVVYADVLFLINYILNYIVLWTSTKIFKIKAKTLRIVIGATIGAIYSVFVFFPNLKPIYSAFCKVAVSVIMVVVTYNPKNVKQFLRYFAGFYGVNFLLAGIMFALFYCTDLNTVSNNGVYYINVSIKMLGISVIIAFILMRIIWRLVQKYKIKTNQLYILCIKIGDKKVATNALVDTGNSLTDPISGLPVIIVQASVFDQILPKSLLSGDIQVLAESEIALKVRVIPFKSLGNDNGMLIGFKPDEIFFSDGENEKTTSDVIVGIYANTLSKNQEYGALLSPDLLI